VDEQPPAAAATKLACHETPNIRPTACSGADLACCSAAAAAAGPGYASGNASTPLLLQLLCGFADLGLERRFLAATFSSSATLDLFTAVYNMAMGVGCWFAAGGKLPSLVSPQQQQQQQHYMGSAKFIEYQAAAAAAWLGGWSVKLVWSVVMVFLLHMGASMAIAVLRLRTMYKLQQVRKQQELLSGNSAATCSNGAEQQPEQATAAAAAAAVVSQAGFERQQLLTGCVVSISVLNLMCATGGVTAPIMIVRAWGLHSWAQDAATTLVLVVKAWMYQVGPEQHCTLHD
jgi:hypothetical protein